MTRKHFNALADSLGHRLHTLGIGCAMVENIARGVARDLRSVANTIDVERFVEAVLKAYRGKGGV